jgi:hypothetical protein
MHLLIGAVLLGIFGELTRRVRLLKPPFGLSKVKMEQKLEP